MRSAISVFQLRGCDISATSLIDSPALQALLLLPLQSKAGENSFA
jgi:hypothetical protein